MAEGQSKSGMKVYGPTKERVRKAICHILEYRVNYNTVSLRTTPAVQVYNTLYVRTVACMGSCSRKIGKF